MLLDGVVWCALQLGSLQIMIEMEIEIVIEGPLDGVAVHHDTIGLQRKDRGCASK